MIKILLPLTLLSSTLGIQASDAAPCAADVKTMAASTAIEDHEIEIPDHVKLALLQYYRDDSSEVIVGWLLQNPEVHKNAVWRDGRETRPLLTCALQTPQIQPTLGILLDLCPNVLAPVRFSNPQIKSTTNALSTALANDHEIRKITVMMVVQGASLEALENQVRDLVRAAQIPGGIRRSAIVFDETAKIRQELGEAAECEKALEVILLRDLRRINRTYITDLPAPKQP